MSRLDKVVLSQQQAAVLSELKGGPRNSIQLRDRCRIMAVGTRVCELRRIGFNISTELVPLRSRKRNPAHIARYTLHRRRPGSGRLRVSVAG